MQWHKTWKEQKCRVALLGPYLRCQVHICGQSGCYINAHILGRAVAQLSGRCRGNSVGKGRLKDTGEVNTAREVGQHEGTLTNLVRKNGLIVQ